MVTRRAPGRKKKSGYQLATRGSGGSGGRASSRGLQGAPARKHGLWIVVLLGGLVLVNLYVFVWNKKTSVSAIRHQAEAQGLPAEVPAAPLVPPTGTTGPAAVPTGATARGALPPAPPPVAPPGVIEGKVGKGDSLGRLLKKSGLTGAEADEIIRALSGVLDFRTIRAGQAFRIERGPDGRISLFELVVSKVQKVRAVRQHGELTGAADNSQTRIEIKAIGGRIDSSLYAAIKASGESTTLVEFFVDVFAYDLDFFNDTHEGDTFRVVVEKELGTDGGAPAFLRYKKILAAEYQGKAGTFRTFYFAGDGGKGRYFDDHGEASEKALLKTPLKFSRVSSSFDRHRMHPVLHTVRAHLGIDYAAPVGTPVWAAAGGTIVERGPAGGAGNLVILRHDSGIETAYMHLSKFATGQRVGQRVEAKTVIGFVGATGLATGPHLHFGVREHGVYIDPTHLPPIHGAPVAAKDLPAFRAELARLEGQLAGVVLPSTPPPAAPLVVSNP
jgi:murein DD-endopeptidase MepM/ murein hydrolase activator NlpD